MADQRRPWQACCSPRQNQTAGVQLPVEGVVLGEVATHRTDSGIRCDSQPLDSRTVRETGPSWHERGTWRQ